MTLLLLPLLSVSLTWLIWEAFCIYDGLEPVGRLPEKFHDWHECDDPADCPAAAKYILGERKRHRRLHIEVALIVLGLLFMGVLLTRFGV